MEEYIIYYQKYSIFCNGYRQWITIVNTNDIYHEVGKLVCQSLENIKNIRYCTNQQSRDECEDRWLQRGFHSVGQNSWCLDKKID